MSPDSIALTVDIAGNFLANLIQIGALTDHDRRQGFVGSSNPADYYQFTLDASSRLNVVLDGLTANANVQLLNGAGQVLQSSLNPGTMAESFQRFLVAGTYYLRVSAAPGANTAYTLNLFPDPLPLTAPRLGTNLIQNGSFEEATAAITQSEAFQSNGWISVFAGSTAIPHWQIQASSVDYKITLLWDASDGEAGIDLDGSGAGVIAQTFATLPGQTYRVTFDLSAHGHLLAGSTRPAIVSAAGQQAAFIGVSTQNRRAMGYVSQTWQFVAQDTQTTLSFASPVGDGQGALIDNVVVRAILSQPHATDLIGTTVSENSEAGTIVGQLSSGNDAGGDRCPEVSVGH